MFVNEKEAKELISLRDSIERLLVNRDFKKVFLQGYYKEEPARLAQALANPEMQDEIDQRILHEKIVAIGHLQEFLLAKTRMAKQVEESMKEEEERLKQEMIEEERTVDEITGEVV